MKLIIAIVNHVEEGLKKGRCLRPLLCAALALLLLCGCSHRSKAGDVSAYEVAEIEGVVLELTEISAEKATLTIHNEQEAALSVHPLFALEVWSESDSVWHSVEYRETVFPSCTLKVEVDDSSEMPLDFAFYFGTLRKGDYRALLNISVGNENYLDEAYVPCEFSID